MMQKIIIEKQITVDDFFTERGLDPKLYFISKDGKMVQNNTEQLKIGDNIQVIARISGGLL